MSKPNQETRYVKEKLKVPVESYYGTGKRKSAIAKAWLFPGKGRVVINNYDMSIMFGNPSHSKAINKPLEALGLSNKYDVMIKTLGGGIAGQAIACQLAIARALVQLNSEFQAPLRTENLLSRDARIKERKKYGRKKARKGFQFRKR